MFGQFMPMVFGGGGIIGQFTDHAVNTGSSTAGYTFTGLNFGPVRSDRIIHVCVHANATSNSSITSITINDTPATMLTTYPSNQWNPGMHAYLAVPSGLIGDVRVNISGIWVGCGVFVYGIYKSSVLPSSSVQVGTSSPVPSISGSIATNEGDIVIASSSALNGNSLSWSGVNVDSDVLLGSGYRLSSASAEAIINGTTSIVSSSSGSAHRRLTITKYQIG